jgi:hypothetical protein
MSITFPVARNAVKPPGLSGIWAFYGTVISKNRIQITIGTKMSRIHNTGGKGKYKKGNEQEDMIKAKKLQEKNN